MSFYVGSSSTLVRKVIGDEDLMSVVFNVVVVLDTLFLCWSMFVFLDTVQKLRRLLCKWS